MEEIQIHVGIESLADIMFDQFFDHSKEPRPPEQKFYIQGKNQLVFPSLNIMAFMFNQKGDSCVNKFEGKKRRDYYAVGFSHVSISPTFIPFKDKDRKQINFSDFENGLFYIVNSAPTTKLSGGGFIKQEAKPRPVLKMPWLLEFDIRLFTNPLINETKLRNWFENGGLLIGLGTYRPLFGRFMVKRWEVKK